MTIKKKRLGRIIEPKPWMFSRHEHLRTFIIPCNASGLLNKFCIASIDGIPPAPKPGIPIGGIAPTPPPDIPNPVPAGVGAAELTSASARARFATSPASTNFGQASSLGVNTNTPSSKVNPAANRNCSPPDTPPSRLLKAAFDFFMERYFSSMGLEIIFDSSFDAVESAVL